MGEMCWRLREKTGLLRRSDCLFYVRVVHQVHNMDKMNLHVKYINTKRFYVVVSRQTGLSLFESENAVTVSNRTYISNIHKLFVYLYKTPNASLI